MDVFLIFLSKIPNRGNHRIGNALSQAAYGACFHSLSQLQKDLDIIGPAPSFGNVIEYLKHLPCAQLAQRTLAARLVLGKVQKIAGHIYHTGSFIHHQHAA